MGSLQKEPTLILKSFQNLNFVQTNVSWVNKLEVVRPPTHPLVFRPKKKKKKTLEVDRCKCECGHTFLGA